VYLLGLAQTTGARFDPTVALLMIIGTLWTFFIHANVRCRLGPLEWLVSSPAFHHWHHTNDEHRDRNFASIFPVIDRVFGTAWLPRHWPPVYGIDAPVSPTLVGQLLEPLKGEREDQDPQIQTTGKAHLASK
jgi:sterol desaturase/sphingolipid hydroxylase (fatty acid hydroxylase superfamily)